ncbi:MAG: lysylphosphatidylglycerol synthase transmembrane domain-containing protein [Anaerolineae bacterium]
MSRNRFWIGIAISLICLILALKDVHFAEIGRALGQANYLLLIPALAAVLAGLGARAVRWRLLFYPQRDLRLDKLFSVLNIGYLLSNIFPARLGDLARAYLIGDLEKVSVARALSTVVVERVLDVITIVLFLALLIPFVPLPSWAARSGLVVGALFAALALLLIAVSYQKERGLRVLDRLLGLAPGLDGGRLLRGFGSLIDGFAVLRAQGALPGLIAWSLLAWTCSALINYFVMLAFDPRLPFTAAVFVLCVTVLGMTVPSSPGYVGVFDYLTVVALSLFAVEKDLALSYALVLHAVLYISMSLMGLLSLWRESYSLGQVRGEISSAGL